MTSPRLQILAHLSHLALRAEDPEALAAWYEESMGLVRHRVLEDGRIRLGWGRGHYVLELSEGPPALLHFGLEYPRQGELDSVSDALTRNGLPLRWQDGDEDKPRCAVTADPDGNVIELHGKVDRSGEHNADPGRRPVRVQHLALASPQLETLEQFYTQHLGFVVSDRMGDVFTWMRCDREHHTVAVLAGLNPALDHYSYDVNEWADFKVWCDQLAVRNTLIAWGPGRHGPGNNLFVIFHDAAGFRVELSAEMERYWDDLNEHPPRSWTPGSKTVNLWGPVPTWRQKITV